jgi:FAD/FMN-containing dehydrogenase
VVAGREDYLGLWFQWPPLTFRRAVYDIAAEYGGSFAAGHGVGIVKLAEMERYRSAVELDLMRKFKRLLDPDGLFNPGKVLP